MEHLYGRRTSVRSYVLYLDDLAVVDDVVDIVVHILYVHPVQSSILGTIRIYVYTE